ncbi:hypothetical protein GCM10018793_35490 [Streptomyces sulfonofaciens]|uniref:Uncharacterized protein n=1 Tax=Streptomyces sulfonofaciens TaxID=68272 RepID=A0A919G979_9ACTN|nr:gas vesicle protein GvpG [Streptomyces sulfonofaciens]GHH80402.1 hypothetical protein GCM10018793_35490 [Streptomyces sulfonofaciens]
MKGSLPPYGFHPRTSAPEWDQGAGPGIEQDGLAGFASQVLALPAVPARGVPWVLRQALLAAEQEFHDPGPAPGRSAGLEQELVADRMAEEEFGLHEDEPLDRSGSMTGRRRLRLVTRR